VFCRWNLAVRSLALVPVLGDRNEVRDLPEGLVAYQRDAGADLYGRRGRRLERV
jgi:hypothetical protein